MLLQPIVENSFVHGMRGMDELFIVCLSAKGIRDYGERIDQKIQRYREQVDKKLKEQGFTGTYPQYTLFRILSA